MSRTGTCPAPLKWVRCDCVKNSGAFDIVFVCVARLSIFGKLPQRAIGEHWLTWTRRLSKLLGYTGTEVSWTQPLAQNDILYSY